MLTFKPYCYLDKEHDHKYILHVAVAMPYGFTMEKKHDIKLPKLKEVEDQTANPVRHIILKVKEEPGMSQIGPYITSFEINRNPGVEDGVIVDVENPAEKHIPKKDRTHLGRTVFTYDDAFPSGEPISDTHKAGSPILGNVDPENQET